ncbi:hypothetical protein DLJ53_15415 [Acuticoccus sediminis]|uniref:SPOR domain-containing protein n=1 Tax=Acuticoccus sediminis TaxID=2184697 RepID=A0A8B2NT55_9HYPH|nr:SPOR domain-containing protein [Acuticoccus sediminis]RAI00644.1 hypothetical protein DLJ53_15415 [Acuticoccus sediminis]
MNGPTRSSAFERHGPVGTGSHKSADIYDELDQFVDSEPAVWGPGQRPASQGAGPDPRFDNGPQQDRGDDDGADAYLDEADRDDGGLTYDDAPDEYHPQPGFARSPAAPEPEPAPGFSAGAADRRSKFTQRLNEELSRPTPRPEPKAELPAARPQPSVPQPSFPHAAVPQAPRKPSEELRAREDARIREELRTGISAASRASLPSRGLKRSPPGTAAPAAPSAPIAPDWKRERTDAPAASGANLPAVTSKPSPSDEPPADALDWELGNAIGEIIAGHAQAARNQAASGPTAVPPLSIPHFEAPDFGAEEHDTAENPPAEPEAAPRIAPPADAPAATPSDAPMPMPTPTPTVAAARPVLPPPSPTPAPVPVAARAVEPDAEDAPHVDVPEDEVPFRSVEEEIGEALALGNDTAPEPAAPQASPRSRATPIAADIPLAAARSATHRELGPPPVAPATVPINPQLDLSGKRVKPIPSFRFQRREEQAEAFPAAPPDLDDPLASVFMSDARSALASTRPGAKREYTDYADDDAYEDFEDDEFEFDDDDLDDELPPSLVRASHPVRSRKRRVRRGAVVAAVSVAAVVVAGIVGFNVFAGSDGRSGSPPVIHADARDVKTRPEDEGSTARPEIDERVALGDNDRLVVPDPVRIGPQEAPPAPSTETETRSVRTVVVRPDGTIVPTQARGSGASRSTPSYEAPAAAPPAGGGTDAHTADTTSLGETTAAAARPAEPLSATRPEASVTSTPMDSTYEDNAAESDESFGEVDGTDLAALDAAVTPRPRPAPPNRSSASQRTSVAAPAASTATTVAAAPAQEPAAAATAPASSTSLPWGVQVASRRDMASAEASFRDLQRRFPSVLGNSHPSIVAATVGDRGMFYRVRVGASSYAEANQLCSRLKSAGGDCFVGRN